MGGTTATTSNEGSSSGSSEKIKLDRQIGLFEAVAITVGAIVGSGIFISPKGIISHVGSVGMSLVIWTLSGGIAMLGAFCMAELGTTFPSAGGQYTYIYQAFGPSFGFMYLWSNILMLAPLYSAVFGLAFAKYALQPFFPVGCEIPETAIRLLAGAAICFFTFLNCCRIKNTNKVTNVLMILKLSALTALILGGIYAVLRGTALNVFDTIWDKTDADPGSLTLAIFSGSFAFGGWAAMSHMMEELQNPNKNLPRGISISLIMITLIYLLANLSYFAVLTPEEMMASDAVAVTFMEKLFGSYGWIVPLFVSTSILGTLSIHTMTSSRVCFDGARQGHFPSVLSLITTFSHTPAIATIFMGCLSLTFLITADVFALIEFGGFTGGFFFMLTIGGQLYLRWKKPELERPFKVSVLLPIGYLIVAMLMLIIPIYEKPYTSSIGVVIVLSSLPVYYFVVQREKTIPFLDTIERCVTQIIQKLLLSAKQD